MTNLHPFLASPVCTGESADTFLTQTKGTTKHVSLTLTS